MIDWEETCYDRLADEAADDQSARIIAVADGVCCHSAKLSPGASIEDMLADYASDYDAGEPGTEIEVEWTLYERGGVVRKGRFEFVSRH